MDHNRKQQEAETRFAEDIHRKGIAIWLVYLKGLFELDDEPPVIPCHVIHEMLLQQLNRLSGYFAD